MFPLDQFFNDILYDNPLRNFEKFEFVDYNRVALSLPTLKRIADLPKMSEIRFYVHHSYGSFSEEFVQSFASYVRDKDYDIVYKIPTPQ